MFLGFSDVEVLNRQDFLRLNHELSIPHVDEILYNEDDERIWLGEDGDDELTKCSASVKTAQTQSGKHSNTFHTIGQSLSTVSVTLSVKSLNRWSVVAITDDDVTPSQEWKDVVYFQDNLKKYLVQLYQHQMNLLCSYGWPHVMRGNSLLLIGKRLNNNVQCLSTVCSIVHVSKELTIKICLTNNLINKMYNQIIFSDRLQREKSKEEVNSKSLEPRREPIAIILVNGTEEVEKMGTLCRKMLYKAGMRSITVSCLNSAFETALLKELKQTDILVTSAFCFDALFQSMPNLFSANRLRIIWIDQIDELMKVDEVKINKVRNTIFKHGLILPNLQVKNSNLNKNGL